jgi:hypothetical protein
MTVSEKRREYENRRGHLEATLAEFDAYTAAFAEDVDAKRAAMDDARNETDALAAEFDVAGDAFDTSVRELAEDVAARQAELESADSAFDEYARALADDLEAKRADTEALARTIAADAERIREEAAAMNDSASFLADVDALVAGFESTGSAFTAATESFAAERGAVREEAARNAEAIADKRAAFDAFVSDFYGDDGLESRESVEPTGPDARTLSKSAAAADPTAVEDESDTAASDSGGDRADTSTRLDEGVETDGPGAEPSPDDEDGDERADDTDAGPNQRADGSDAVGDEDASTEAFEQRLRQLQYGKLKRAANRVGYEGNLNAAKKDELVAFLVQNRAELEEAFTDDDTDE